MRTATFTAALLAASAYLAAPTPVTAQFVPDPGQTLTLPSADGPYHSLIPTVDPPGTLRFVIKGGAGGNAHTINSDCTSIGGRGARVAGTFGVGHGPGELAPGGEFVVVVGEAGVEARSGTSSWTQSFLRAAAGGGGGSGVLYRGPGETEWTTLLVAGGGGGAGGRRRRRRKQQGRRRNGITDDERTRV